MKTLLGLLLSGWLLAACGGGVARSGTEAPSGNAGSAGSFGSSDTAGSAGSQSTKPDGCAVQPLSTFCSSLDRCPAGPDDVPLNCNGAFSRTTRSGTACGGTVIEASYGLGGTIWYFDANGRLVGLRSISDTGPVCYDEAGIATYGATTYGTVCGALGEAQDLCQAACTDQPPLTEDGVVLTEDSYDFLSHCSEDGTQVIRTATICGGNRYQVRRDEYGTSENYCFDEAGRLIGSFTYDQAGTPVERGATCKPADPEEYLCATNP